MCIYGHWRLIKMVLLHGYMKGKATPVVCRYLLGELALAPACGKTCMPRVYHAPAPKEQSGAHNSYIPQILEHPSIHHSN